MFCFKFYEIVISTLHYPCNPCVTFLVLQTCKLEDVDAVIEQFHDIFCTTLRECLIILGENVVILFISYSFHIEFFLFSRKLNTKTFSF